jgi:hypothetical protein
LRRLFWRGLGLVAGEVVFGHSLFLNDMDDMGSVGGDNRVKLKDNTGKHITDKKPVKLK